MALSPLRCGGYVLLAVAGWAAGRWVWPGKAADAISREFDKQNPEAALAWVASLPEAYQSESVGFLLSAWKDKVAAALAVERLPDGPMKAAAWRNLLPDPKDPFR